MTKKNPWVLLVDDDPEFSKVLSVFLKKMGVHLELSSSPEEFVMKLKEENPTLCLVDLNLNGVLAGYALVKSLRKKWPKLPLIVVSASADAAAISYAIEVGADDFLAKPINLQVLKSKLSKYIQLVNTLETEVKLQPAPAGGIEASIGFKLEVLGLDELGCRLISPHFLCKGAPLYLSGTVFAEALHSRETTLASVVGCEIGGEGRYLVEAEFVELTKEEQAGLRKYIFEKKS